MRKVILYIAMSLDGCIADSTGGVAWLGGESPDYDGDYGYADFVARVDTVLMGAHTYRQIAEELSPDCWPYAGMQTYVLTNHPGHANEELHFVQGSVCSLVETLRAQQGGDIWICGGANLAAQLQEADLIDEYHLSIMPVLLGEGIRLFPGNMPPIKLALRSHAVCNGVVDLCYVRREVLEQA